MPGPLDGVKVIELAHVMAGPVCGRMLADMGADVVKVERPGAGDPTRRFVPPHVEGRSAAFLMLNRNKRGIALDLKDTAGKEALRHLLRKADVVVENFRVGTMERLGFGYEALREDNPRLVYCQVTGFGRTGPMAELGGFDLIAQGYAGLMSVTGEGGPRPPVKCGPPLTDITAGILAAMGVSAALAQREKTGVGQRVDTSLYEAGITQTFWQSAIALASGASPGPLGSAHPLSAPYECFGTLDGWLNVGGSNDATWLRLTRAIGREELAEDSRFETNAARMANVAVLREILTEVFRTRTTDAWLDVLAEAAVPAGPVASIGEMLANPQTRAREMVVPIPVGTETVETLGMPVKFSGAPCLVERGAPDLGADTREVLVEYGVADTIVDAVVGDL